MKRTIILSAIAILLTASSLGYFFWFNPTKIEQKVLAEKEQSKDSVKNLISAPGMVEPISEEIEVGTEIAGKLKQVLVEEGNQITKGQTIAILENADFQANIASAKTQIETLRSQQETAEAKLSQQMPNEREFLTAHVPKNGARLCKLTNRLCRLSNNYSAK